MYSITKNTGGYYANCQIQDGNEGKTLPTVKEAIQWLIKAANAFNNQKITKKDINFFKEVPIQATEIIDWDGKE